MCLISHKETVEMEELLNVKHKWNDNSSRDTDIEPEDLRQNLIVK